MKKPEAVCEEAEKGKDIQEAGDAVLKEAGEYLDLRPKRLSDYIGQKQVVETLDIAIQAAKKRGEPLDHILFHAPPALARRPSPTSLPRRWVSTSLPLLDPPSKKGET